jgi:endonuclease YncB( thermonuclease family)
MADDSAGMRKGTVEQVSVNGGTFHVYRQRLTFDPLRVKVFGKDGKPASVQSLRAGSSVRFTMDPTDKSKRRVAVIYID